MPRIALLTDSRYTAATAPEGDWYLANILHDDRLLREALTNRGYESERVDWADPSIDWSQFDVAVFRTTWDYFIRYPEFMAWLERVERQTQLLNPPATIRWNRDKHYLADLERAGVAIVPTRFIDRGDQTSLHRHLGDWPEAVIKPCVSGGARHTHRLTSANADAIGEQLRPIIAEESFLIQPFQKSILENGEYSLMLFEGRFTHAVRKNGTNGDFRVQDDFGGTVQAYDPPADQIAFAERAVAVCSPQPIYARVDIVTANDGGWAIMELELIEPELWLRYHPPAAEAFAAGIVAACGQVNS